MARRLLLRCWNFRGALENYDNVGESLNVRRRFRGESVPFRGTDTYFVSRVPEAMGDQEALLTSARATRV